MNPPNGMRDAPESSLEKLAREGPHSLSEPWEAEVMSLSIALQEAGCFTSDECSAALGARINSAAAAKKTEDATNFSELLLAALEELACDKGLVDRAELRARRRDWEDAYREARHGAPVRLRVQKS